MQSPQIPTFDPAQQRQVIPSSMVTVVNALDITIKFEVGGNPGNPAMWFTLHPGDQANVPKTFCDPIEGANPEVPRPSILAMKTSVEPYPGGRAIQGVVPLHDAERTRAAWLRAKLEQPRTATVMLHDNEGNPIPLGIPRQGVGAAPAQAAAPTGNDPMTRMEAMLGRLAETVAHQGATLATLVAGAAPPPTLVAPVPAPTAARAAAAPADPADDDEIEDPPPGAPDLRASSPAAPTPPRGRGGKVVGEPKGAGKAAGG